MENLWYKNAIIYGLDIKTFQDSNDDGIGDFRGLISRLDYLADLGISCIWLLPFYPSPNRDNGYDVTDFYNIDPSLGTLDDFKAFLKKAHRLKIRVIVDFVIHHTSNKHPWFEGARRDKKSIFRDYYIWSKKRPKTPQPGSAFPGPEKDVWHYDKVAKAWYFHHFYYFQPDLNIVNPDVQYEILKIADFWLGFGVDGLRMDAAGLLFTYKGLPYTAHKAPWIFLKNLNKLIRRRNKEGVLLAEADTKPEEMPIFFGRGDRVHMLLNFHLNQSIFAALAAENSKPIIDIFNLLPKFSKKNEWVNFVRNLDELNIDKLSKANRKLVYEKFGRGRNARIYGRGIRRRAAPMLGNSNELRMVFTLLFALPGVPLICYGDEIGMGDDLSLPERNSVRTPMQWSAKINAGFSKAGQAKLIAPIISKGPFGYRKINVENAQKNKTSLYNVIKKLIILRKKFKILGHMDPNILELSSPHVLAFRYNWKGQAMIVLFNLGRKKVQVKLPVLNEEKFQEIHADQFYPDRKDSQLNLHPYGYRWFYRKKKVSKKKRR